jgi:hypothetical protein
VKQYLRRGPFRQPDLVDSDGSRTVINGTFDWVYEELVARWLALGLTGATSHIGSSMPQVRDFSLIQL